jgi:hypothetical protein
LRQLAFGIKQSFLEGTNPLRCILKAATKGYNLLFHRRKLRLQLSHPGLVFVQAPFVVGSLDDNHLLQELSKPDPTPTIGRMPNASSGLVGTTPSQWMAVERRQTRR